MYMHRRDWGASGEGIENSVRAASEREIKTEWEKSTFLFT